MATSLDLRLTGLSFNSSLKTCTLGLIIFLEDTIHFLLVDVTANIAGSLFSNKVNTTKIV